MKELKPCPFCGDNYPLKEVFSVRKGWEATVHCNNCLATITTITFDFPQTAEIKVIEAWNRRVEK